MISAGRRVLHRLALPAQREWRVSILVGSPGSSAQTEFSTVNGRSSVRVIEQHVYVFRPRKRGAFKIAPAMVRHNGYRKVNKGLYFATLDCYT